MKMALSERQFVQLHASMYHAMAAAVTTIRSLLVDMESLIRKKTLLTPEEA